MRKTGAVVVTVAALAGLLTFAGCQTEAQTDALIGAGIGAAAGQAIGGNTESTLIGGAVGGGAGYIIGNEADKAKATEERRMNRQMSSTYVIRVRNSNGSTTPVTLRQSAGRWIGPNGEEYDSLPTEAQLRPMYAR